MSKASQAFNKGNSNDSDALLQVSTSTGKGQV
jgi:hypothetical protein